MSEPQLLSEEAIAEIEAMFPHAEYQPDVEDMPPCAFCDGAIDDHKANCVVPHVHALCQTVRLLLDRETKYARVLSDRLREMDALGKWVSCANDEDDDGPLCGDCRSCFAAENTALRDQLAHRTKERDDLYEQNWPFEWQVATAEKKRREDAESRLAQVEKERSINLCGDVVHCATCAEAKDFKP